MIAAKRMQVRQQLQTNPITLGQKYHTPKTPMIELSEMRRKVAPLRE